MKRMNSLATGCQGAAKLRTPTWEEKKCPQCVKWCAKAKECVGEEMYQRLMKVGEE